MVRNSDDPTLRQMKIPLALIVDGSEALISCLSEAALAAQVLVAECNTRDAPTLAAEMRPLILAMSQRVYDRDAESFVALARDVRASLLVLPSQGASAEIVQEMLEVRMTEAEAQRPSWCG